MRVQLLASGLALALAACATGGEAPKEQVQPPAVEAPAEFAAPAAPDPLTDPRAYASIEELQAGMTAGEYGSADLVKLFQARIALIDHAGPRIQSVLALNPDALAQAEALDAERKAKGPRGPLHGVPVLIKDNIETKDPIPTTAGSLALKDNITGRDAPLVARLREAGAVILGKTNLSEWANIRDQSSISGWSGMGGLTRNPHSLDRTACGSSSGSGAAIAAGLATAAVGTETDGSVVCPSAINGLVGVKPTVGLVSRSLVIPISESQDTAGPMTRSVRDAALMLAAMSGTDAADAATAQADRRKADYAAALAGASLQGKRIGVLLEAGPGFNADLNARFEEAQAALKAAGATLVEIEDAPPRGKTGQQEYLVLLTELKAGLNAYLANAAPAVTTRTLADVIAFNAAHAAEEMPLFQQSIFEESEKTKGLDDPEYKNARKESRAAMRAFIDGLLKREKLDALIAPTYSAAWMIDVVNGDASFGGFSSPAAVSGYPHVTVPMGTVKGLPVGLSFVGTAWDEAKLLELAAAYEAVAPEKVRPSFPANLDTAETVAPALQRRAK